MLSREAVVSGVRELQEAVKDWEANGPTEAWKGAAKPTLSVSADLGESFDDLFQLCQTMDVADDARGLVLEIDGLQREVQAWTLARTQRGAGVDPGGSHAMWVKYGVVVSTAKSVLRRDHCPDLKRLVADNVPHPQIARICRFKDEPGLSAVDKVMAENMLPIGEHRFLDPATWLSTRDEKIARDVADRWAARTVKAKRGPRQPSPQSFEELASLDNMTLGQLARMKCVTEQEAQEQLDDLGMKLGVKRAIRTATDRANYQIELDQKRREDAEFMQGFDLHDEISDIGEKIKVMAETDRRKIGHIARALSIRQYGEAGKVTSQWVTTMLQRANGVQLGAPLETVKAKVEEAAVVANERVKPGRKRKQEPLVVPIGAEEDDGLGDE